MADQPVTIEKLINADKDVQVIEDFIKKPKDETVTTRFGDKIMTLKGLEEEVKKSGGYFKRYTSLAAANADIANIPVDAVVKVTSAVDGGDYERASAGATSLTKSPYDPVNIAKTYTDQERLIKFNSVNAVGSPTLTAAQAKLDIIALWGTLTQDSVITFPKTNGRYILQDITTRSGFKLSVKTEGQISNILELPIGGKVEVINNAASIIEVADYKANVNSPTLTGSPKAPTPSTTSNDTSIATTKFVNDLIQFPDGALVILDTSAAVDGVLTVTAEQFRRSTFLVTGAMPQDITIVVPSTPRKEFWVHNNTVVGNYNLKIKTDTQTAAATNLPIDGIKVRSIGTSVLVGGTGKASINSPTFIGIPKATTPSSTSNDNSLATTSFVRNSSRGIVDVPLTDSSTTIPDLAGAILRLTGVLSNPIELNFDLLSGQGQWIVLNSTNVEVSLKGIGQTSDIVRIAPGGAVDVYVRATVVRRIPFSSTNLPAASPNILGGIKVGAGLSITPDGVLNASSGQSGISLRHAGKFKQGGNYIAGQLVEHGSGMYEVTANANNVSSPLNHGSFNKIMPNLYAGHDENLEVLSNQYEVVSAVSTMPTYMSKDGMICFNNSTNNLRISYDYGRTWDPTPIFSPETGSWMRWTKELDDGELLVCVSQVDADRPHKTHLYKSTGWKGNTTQLPTWQKVMTYQKQNNFLAEWGFSNYGKFVTVAEYGGHNRSGNPFSEDYPRYVYFSKDSGRTWEIIFDLGDFTDGIGVHLHGAAFDPYWNRIWVSHGDGVGGTNGLYYSDDLGKTWTSGTQFNNPGPNFPQSVGIIPMPTCILFASDSYPNGMQRIDRAQGRIPHKGYYNIEIGYAIPEQQEQLNHIIKGIYKAKWLPNAPLIFTWAAESIAGKTGCALTWDGWNFHEVWLSDHISDAGRGPEYVIGPTAENTIIISGNENENGGIINYKRTLAISID